MWDCEDTVCAIATPVGAALRGAVRITGPQTFAVLERLLVAEARAGSSCNACDLLASTRLPVAIDARIDLNQPLGIADVMVLYWPSSRSYTGQPSAEIHMIGGGPLLQATIDRLRTAGARLARPGEFTMRAFLAGKLDLTQAEAVLGVIEADSPAQLGAALDQLTGGISGPLIHLRKSMIELLADVEAGLDFVDEDIQFIDDETLAQRLDAMSEVVKQADVALSGRARASGLPSVVLCGRPNAGKSSLLNRLANSDAAIVSAQTGTTRDPVEVHVMIGSNRVRLIDLAGLEFVSATESEQQTISAQAQELARKLIKDADLRIWCSTLECWPERSLENPPPHVGQCVKVATKSDLLQRQADHGKQQQSLVDSLISDGWILVSSANSSGIDNLLSKLQDELSQAEANATVASTAARCRETLQNAAAGLIAAAAATRSNFGHELVSAELRLAIDAIGQVTGAVYTDDILDQVFSRFCIGK